MDELKPCPFCGADAAVLYKNYPGDSMKPVYLVECEKCNSNTPECESKDVVISAWNTRPIEEAQAATIAQQAETIRKQAERINELCAMNANILEMSHEISEHHDKFVQGQNEGMRGRLNGIALKDCPVIPEEKYHDDFARGWDRGWSSMDDYEKAQLFDKQAVRIEKMRKALEWYADDFNYSVGACLGPDGNFDEGRIAAEALRDDNAGA